MMVQKTPQSELFYKVLNQRIPLYENVFLQYNEQNEIGQKGVERLSAFRFESDPMLSPMVENLILNARYTGGVIIEFESFRHTCSNLRNKVDYFVFYNIHPSERRAVFRQCFVWEGKDDGEFKMFSDLLDNSKTGIFVAFSSSNSTAKEPVLYYVD